MTHKTRLHCMFYSRFKAVLQFGTQRCGSDDGDDGSASFNAQGKESWRPVTRMAPWYS